MKPLRIFELPAMNEAERTLFLVMMSTTRGQKMLADMSILHGVSPVFPLVETDVCLPGGDYFLVETGNGHATSREDMDDVIKYGRLYGNVFIDYNVDNKTYDYYIRFK